MDNRIAITGMACRYADANSAQELWTNVLAQRKGFRRFPRERLDLASYWSSDPKAVDSTNARSAALIEGYTFDRERYRIAADTFRSADMVHWLALDVATEALADAGFNEGAGLPHETTGVVVGNTLTGEFSRAGILRQRWPYVGKVLGRVLQDEGWESNAIAALQSKIERVYKEPFPVPGPESLAGSLSNTIAGRICNYYDLNGGGYVVDGACCSSLLAVIEGCSALLSGDMDIALAGGVDLSLDPFELVGFARAGAIAAESMRVFDARPTGFLPGEGCGFLVLRRYEDAVASGDRIYSVIRGWGISSDGAGGLTRPEVEGQSLALRRAYRRAGFSIKDVDYFEAHGTGTEVGDTVELQTILAERRSSGADTPATIGSVKALIGHTKAAAGVAGLIKASMAVWHGVLPPTAGFTEPHSEIRANNSLLRLSSEAKHWKAAGARRAGISAMGFGGINTHIVIEESPGTSDRPPAPLALDRFVASDCDLFLLSASSHTDLLASIETLIETVPALSLAELSDLAAALSIKPAGALRAAIVAATPEGLTSRLQFLKELLQRGVSQHFDLSKSIFLGSGTKARIGFLFSGQASPVRREAGVLGKYFWGARSIYHALTVPEGSDTDTSVVQPAITAASLAGMMALDELGIRAEFALGHSVGEIAAWCWAGAFSRWTALSIAKERGRLMAGTPPGAMLGVSAPGGPVARLCAGEHVEIAAFNSARQTVLSGEPHAIARAEQKARASGWQATLLPVSHAFHSRMMEPVADPLRKVLNGLDIGVAKRLVYSTISGNALPPDANLEDLLVDQLTSPVRFQEALLHAQESGADLLIEVGPGAILTGICNEPGGTPAVALDSCSRSHHGLFATVAAAFAVGVSINTRKLFEKRFSKHFEIGRRKSFLSNPCETIVASNPLPLSEVQPPESMPSAPQAEPMRTGQEDPVLAVRELVARAVDLPLARIKPSDRMLDDLRLNSIVVAEIAAKAAQALGRPPLIRPTGFSNASIEQLAAALMTPENGESPASTALSEIPGLFAWVRCFTNEYQPLPLYRTRTSLTPHSRWSLHIPAAHPLRSHFERAFAQPGEGIVFCVPPGDRGEAIADILRLVQRLKGSQRFICVHHGGGYSAFLRSVFEERRELNIAVVRVPVAPDCGELAYAEAIEASGFSEAWYEDDGRRTIPALRVLPVAPSIDLPLASHDVLLVTGGAKGIGAECALALARRSGARLILLGRSSMDGDTEVSQNIQRFSAAGVRFHYVECDVSDQPSVTRVLSSAQASFGKITAVLHAAGRNLPVSIAALRPEDLTATLAPKVAGLENILQALDLESLRLCLSFGSIIGRIGMRGNADYAFANEQLRLQSERWSALYPECRFLTLEWSMWSAVGMAERLNSVETLARQGLSAISPEQGVLILEQALSTPSLSDSVVVTAQFTALPNYLLSGAEAPMLRFIEKIVRFIPGVEIVAEATLGVDTDPYLLDHRLHDSRLFPAVMGIEAMLQAAQTLGLDPVSLIMSGLHFEQPIVASENQPTTIRLLAVRERDESVRVSLRSSNTGFQVDHFRATLCQVDSLASEVEAALDIQASALPLHSSQDIYSNLLFQSGRFRRIENYETLSDTTCRAILKNCESAWFASYMPSALVWGDPGVRDAMMHAIQSCIPMQIIVPLSVEKIVRLPHPPASEFVVHACESASDGGTFTYNIDLKTIQGALVEQWRGVVFSKIEAVPLERFAHSPILIAPYLQRRAKELLSSRGIALSIEVEARHTASTELLQRMNGPEFQLLRRADRKPEIYQPAEDAPVFVSSSNTEGLSLAVQSNLPMGCDVEIVEERDGQLWKSMLGAERYLFCQHLATGGNLPESELATRLWCLREALLKSGFDEPGTIRLVKQYPDGWLEFESGHALVFTWSARLRHTRIALAISASYAELESREINPAAAVILVN